MKLTAGVNFVAALVFVTFSTSYKLGGVLNSSLTGPAGTGTGVNTSSSATGNAASDLVQMGSPESAWNRNVSQSPLDPDSSAIINWLRFNGGWGGYVGWGYCDGRKGFACDNFTVAAVFDVLQATASTPLAPFRKKTVYLSPDCDDLTHFPLPPGGRIQGQTGYSCPYWEDCHMFVYNSTTHILYESYGTDVVDGVVTSNCGVIWNMSPDFTYGPTLRDNPTSDVGSGDQCTSADAAGLPMSPFMFSADDIARGSIDHALRLTLPNGKIRALVYVRPAVHRGGSRAVSSSAPPYGTRFRLKASFNISGFSAGARVVAKALQEYGMIIADGGDHCLSAVTDKYTIHKWSDADVDLTAINSDLVKLTPGDFEIVDTGSPIAATFKCRRTPLTGPPLTSRSFQLRPHFRNARYVRSTRGTPSP